MLEHIENGRNKATEFLRWTGHFVLYWDVLRSIAYLENVYNKYLCPPVQKPFKTLLSYLFFVVHNPISDGIWKHPPPEMFFGAGATY